MPNIDRAIPVILIPHQRCDEKSAEKEKNRDAEATRHVPFEPRMGGENEKKAYRPYPIERRNVTTRLQD